MSLTIFKIFFSMFLKQEFFSSISLSSLYLLSIYYTPGPTRSWRHGSKCVHRASEPHGEDKNPPNNYANN